MIKIALASNEFLGEYILGSQLAKKADISPNAYLFWKGVICAKFGNSRIVFLHKKSIPPKFENLIKECDSLDGLVLSSAFCSFTGLPSSHLTKSNSSNFYKLIEIRKICGIKFVNLKKFYDDLGLDYKFQLYIEKCKFFSQTHLEKRIKLTPTLCLGYY